MSLKIGTSLRRALRFEQAVQIEDVHFHSGPDGRVYPCDVDRCDSPHMTVHDIHARR